MDPDGITMESPLVGSRFKLQFELEDHPPFTPVNLFLGAAKEMVEIRTKEKKK
jgi:hypothetical protein